VFSIKCFNHVIKNLIVFREYTIVDNWLVHYGIMYHLIQFSHNNLNEYMSHYDHNNLHDIFEHNKYFIYHALSSKLNN